MVTWTLAALFTVSISGVLIPCAWSKDYHLKFSPGKENLIENLEWDESVDTLEPLLQIRENPLPENSPYYVTLTGNYSRKDGQIIFEDKLVLTDQEDKFKIEVDVSGDQREIDLTEIDAFGNTETQKGLLIFPDWAEFLGKPQPRRWSVDGGPGFTFLNYQQTSVTTLSEFAVTLQANGHFLIWGPFEAGATVHYTIPLKGTPNLQLFGFDVRGGYRVFKTDGIWDLRLFGGYYYLTCFSSGQFGFQNLMGPEIFPTLKRTFSPDRSAWIYAKYSPLMEGFGFFNLKNGEFAVGGGYNFAVQAWGKTHHLGATLDISLVNLTYAAGAVHSSSFTVGASYVY